MLKKAFMKLYNSLNLGEEKTCFGCGCRTLAYRVMLGCGNRKYGGEAEKEECLHFIIDKVYIDGPCGSKTLASFFPSAFRKSKSLDSHY